MIADGDESNENEIDCKELLQEIYENGQDSELTRLTEMVRQHYLSYLEKQLQENLVKSNFDKIKHVNKDSYNEICKNSIKKTAQLLEDKAVKACMIAKFYQRAMVKIIAIVRRTTEEKRLLSHLEKCIQIKEECKPITSSKETQTENVFREDTLNCNKQLNYNEAFTINLPSNNEDERNENVMSLDEKIEMFKKHLQKEKCVDAVKKYPLNKKKKKLKKYQNETNCYGEHYRHYEAHHSKHKEEVYFSPTSSVVTAPTTSISPGLKHQADESSLIEIPESNVKNENSNDSVALELARLFSEEKTELDEIFGIDPNEEPDDPQICKILKEIEEAKVVDTRNATNLTTQTKIENLQPESLTEPKKIQDQSIALSARIDLSKSIWPCELFMQRRKLSESLARLIDEDLRWHDIIKWKFLELFGEDSDDEFTPCSPSIELNQVLIGSCIRRISPWVVKYLMKPMRDGLIGNRFLFKKLAKNLAQSIIMENQYPDEAIIKECVENYFCLHQAVMSLEDLSVNFPSIPTSF